MHDESINPNPEVEEALDLQRSDVGERERGEGVTEGATGFRAERVQFDLYLAQGFSEPFAKFTLATDADGCYFVRLWDFDIGHLAYEYTIEPNTEIDELIAMLKEMM